MTRRERAVLKKRRVKQGRSARSLLITAYHEAGHAVAAATLDIAFEKVTIIPQGKGAGRITYADLEPEIREAWAAGDRLNNAQVRQWVERQAIVTLAGSVAQRHFSPRSDWKFGREGDATFPGFGKVLDPSSDMSKAVRLIDDLGFTGKVAAAYMSYVEASAEALITELWDDVRKVAQRLLEEKTLWADDVHQMIFGAFDLD